MNTTNPFQTLLTGLSATEYTPVTLEYLKHVSDVVNEQGIVIQTYGEAFQTLVFLDTARAIELVQDTETEVFKIRKLT